MTSIKNKLLNWFISSDSGQSKVPDMSLPTTGHVAESGANAPSALPIFPEPEVQRNLPALEAPRWLSDEDTLRDEGVLFGLSESESTEKTDIILKYFWQLSAGHSAEIEQKNEEIQEYNLFIGQKAERIQYLADCLQNVSQDSGHHNHFLPRTLVGLVLSVVICVSNYFLIQEALQPAYPGAPMIAVGVFCAGMFNLFGRFSFFHDADKKANWRSILEEIGLPLAAATFVLVHSLQYQTQWQAVGLFIFVLFLFLFAGKLLLSNVTMLRKDVQSWLKLRREQANAKADKEAWSIELADLDDQLSQLRVKRWQALREQAAAETERDQLFARRDMLVKIFESEFSLARRMKGQLSGRELKYIQDEQQ